MPTTILSVKVIGFCSKHRKNLKKNDCDILTYKNGDIIPDDEIHCIECLL